MSNSEQNIMNTIDVSDVAEGAFLVLYNPKLSEKGINDIKSQVDEMYELDGAGLYSLSLILDAHHDENQALVLSDEDINILTTIENKGIHTIEIGD